MTAVVHFQHSAQIWADFPELVPGVLCVEDIAAEASVDVPVAEHAATARSRLAGGSEAELSEVQAWRRAFSRMGLKPTQYRCASEALLRRLRKEGSLPQVHPIVDLCNAVSVSTAIPVVAFDLAQVVGDLEVRRAVGDEDYLTFAGTVEHPQPGEVVFADGAGQAHARRWTNRQSSRSAVQAATGTVLIVAEALHSSAAEDVRTLIATLAREIEAAWSTTPVTAVLSLSSRRFACPG